MMFCFGSILQIWIIFIDFRDMNDFVNLSICKHDFKFTCRGAAEAIADLPLATRHGHEEVAVNGKMSI